MIYTRHRFSSLFREFIWREKRTNSSLTKRSMRTLLRLETIPAIRFESCVIFPYGPIG